MGSNRKLILLGTSAFAEVAFEYFTHESEYDVVAFSVDRAFCKDSEFMGRPVVPFEELECHFDPKNHSFYAAMVYTQLNRLRTRMYKVAKAKGYTPASYISRRAFIWQNVHIGEHCFIFENNVVQPFVHIGDNVVLWSGNHIGHHSKVAANVFISSHVVLSGFCEVGENCFFGVNAAIGNNVRIGQDCLIGAGATVVKDVTEDMLVPGNLSDLSRHISAKRFSKVSERAA